MRILGLVGVVGLLGLSLKTRLGRRLGGALVMLSLLGGATVMASDTKFTQESTIAEAGLQDISPTVSKLWVRSSV